MLKSRNQRDSFKRSCILSYFSHSFVIIFCRSYEQVLSKSDFFKKIHDNIAFQNNSTIKYPIIRLCESCAQYIIITLQQVRQ